MKTALAVCIVGISSAFPLLSAEANATPATKPDPLVGEWRYFNDHVVTITADGKLASPKATGTWEFTNNKEVERRYKLTWEGGLFIDTLLLSRDGSRLTGKNQKGDKISATRVAP